jgi:hypothetical protein
MTAPSLNILVAYPYANSQMIEMLRGCGPELRFVLDSGAFTAWKAGKPIELDNYCRFIEQLPVKPWRYFTLDVIGDPEGTMRNYETMLKRGFKPVPIFTRGEDPSVLEDYYKTSDVVGVGGLVGTPNNRGFVRGIMRHVGKRDVHWLGFTDLDFIKVFKPYMCDSSTWESGARYGALKLYLGRGKFKSVKKTDFANKPDPAILERIKYLGLDPYQLSQRDSWYGGYSPSRSLCARSSVVLSVDVERSVGTKLFLAVAATIGLDLVISGFRALYQKATP